jgi:hypothetical protein
VTCLIRTSETDDFQKIDEIRNYRYPHLNQLLFSPFIWFDIIEIFNQDYTYE